MGQDWNIREMYTYPDSKFTRVNISCNELASYIIIITTREIENHLHLAMIF